MSVVQMHLHMHVCTRTYTDIDSQTHMCTHACTHMPTYTPTHKRVHVCTTHTHAYTHPHPPLSIWMPVPFYPQDQGMTHHHWKSLLTAIRVFQRKTFPHTSLKGRQMKWPRGLHIVQAFQEQPESRAMVFVKTRDLAEALLQWMLRRPSLKRLKPGKIVGTGPSVDKGGESSSEALERRHTDIATKTWVAYGNSHVACR